MSTADQVYLYNNYSKVAEFYPLNLHKFGQSEHMLCQELSGFATAISAPVLDIGSGTGRSVQAIARSLPRAEIIAVEPSTPMRAVLTFCVMQDEDLRQRVSIYSEPIQTVPLPEKLGAIVAYGVFGHFDLGERQQLWQRLLPRLEKGAPILVELLPMSKPMNFRQQLVQGQRIGRRTYESTVNGTVEGGDLVCIRAEWRISEDGRETQLIENTNYWHVFSVEDLAREAGLQCKRLSPESALLWV